MFPLSPRRIVRGSMRRFNVHGNGSSCMSKETHKIKTSYHLYLSSFQNKYPLSGSALPTDADDSHIFDATQDDHDAFFGPVPSQTEIQNALHSLQQVFGSASHVRNTYYDQLESEVGFANTSLVDQVSSDGSEIDWKEPSPSSHNARILQADVSDKATFAIHLLQTDAYVQRMVKSLSSDKSVWDAVLNNEVVQELKNAITSERDRGSNGMVKNDSPNKKNVIVQISDAIKAKFMEAVEKITKIVNKLFPSARHLKAAYAANSNSFKEKLRISFMLSLMIFLIVVLDRIY